MKLTIVAAVLASYAGATQPRALSATIDLEAYKDNNVLRDSADTANPPTNPVNVLNVWNTGLGYLALDLSSVPVGSTITSASFGAVDLRTSLNQSIKVDLLDVPADWDESSLTFNIALNSYGAVLNPSNNRAEIDPAKLLWEGNLLLNLTSPGEVLATTYTPSGTTDQDLLDALNAELSTGDGKVVMVLRGTSGSNNYVADREHPDYSGPVLHLTYVPEPTTSAMVIFPFVGAIVLRIFKLEHI